MIDPARTITPPDWMDDPAIRLVFDALTDTGAIDPQVLFVGGCVRNTVLGLPPGDIDIATVHKPEAVIRRIEGAGVRAVPTGIEHGTITAVINGKPFEITTLRRDVETDGRRAVVDFTDNWIEDARRRDFTVNTLLADLDGDLYDPTGLGLKDIDSKRIVFVGDANQRVAEDTLRILRFFRFYALYGGGNTPDPVALAACRAGAGKIAQLSRERIMQEMVRILMVDDPAAILQLMFDNGVLREFANPDYKAEWLKSLVQLQKDHDALDLPARMAVVAAGDAEWVGEFEKFIVISNALRADLNLIFKTLAVISGLRVDEAIYRFGNRAALQACLIRHAREGSVPDAETIEQLKNWRAPTFPLSGDDVMKLGVERGPEVGRILNAVEEWWIAEHFRPNESACRAKMKEEATAPSI